MDLNNLIGRSVLVGVVVLTCALLAAPNFLKQKLVLVFHETVRTEDGQRVQVSPERIADFIRDRENGLRLFFPDSPCKPEAAGDVPKEYRCVLNARFITTARVNELMQAFPGLIDEYDSGVAPHPIENFFSFLTEGDFKRLKIKLGLDLQGGMRAIFRADFDSYQARLREKYQGEVVRLNEQLGRADLPATERSDLEQRLDAVNDELNLTEFRKQQLLDEAKSIIDKRLAAQGLTEPEVRAQPESYSISVDMPGVANSGEVLARIQDVVTVEYRIVQDGPTQRVRDIPENIDDLRTIMQLYREGKVDEFEVNEIIARMEERANLKPEEGRIFLYWRRANNNPASPLLPRDLLVLGPPELDGGDMKSAAASVNPGSAWYMITFTLTDTGSKLFGDVTERNVDRRLAILWGDRVVSDPNINEPIYGGHGQITGQFDEAQATEIAGVIREGALPMPLEVLSVSFVGPSLGQESIIAGVISIVLGFIVINAFMVGYYRTSGLVAVVALFLNLLIMAAIMSLMEFTLTLPGFAGAILTVGMAVDANVIIFEKIKEDLRAGKSASVAIENGFNASFWTILDANVTTLIAAVILYLPKDGPIMGFAIVLFFGLVSSMFTALVVSKLLLDWSQYIFRYKSMSIAWGLKE